MALEQHAIPTEVTNYEFRLVGDWTLKQFGWIAGGVVIGILFYAAQIIPPWFRWPLTIFFPVLGLAIGLVPYEGRSLDRWIFAYIKAIYAPTEFVWIKDKPIPRYLLIQPRKKTQTETARRQTQLEQARIEQYIHSLPIKSAADQYDQYESSNLGSINQVLSQAYPDATNIPETPQIVSQYNEPDPQEAPPRESILDQPIPSDQELEQISQQVADLLEDENQKQSAEPQPQETADEEISSPADQKEQASDQQLEQNLQQAMADTQPSSSTETQSSPPETNMQPPPPVQSQKSNLLPPPPLKPNLIAGAIIDEQQKGIPNVIVQINNQHGHPVRALKTNQLGQFSIATPLKSGNYQLIAEKSDYNFNPINLELNDQIVQPILIQPQT